MRNSTVVLLGTQFYTSTALARAKELFLGKGSVLLCGLIGFGTRCIVRSCKGSSRLTASLHKVSTPAVRMQFIIA